jgi:hypothetical protein
MDADHICHQESREAWQDYNNQQQFEHALIDRKTTWSLTAQSILFAAYGLTVTKVAPLASEFRLAVAVSGLVVAALTLIGVVGLIVSKLASHHEYMTYFTEGHCLPKPNENNHLKWGPAGMGITLITLIPDFGTPVLFIVIWSLLLSWTRHA